MPFLVQHLWAGRLHHSIEYGEPVRWPERLGRENDRLRISFADAERGIDALVAENFPEAIQPEAPHYHGA